MIREGSAVNISHGFELMTPKAHIRCAPEAATAKGRECFDLIPGTMGIAGVIVAVELDLKVIKPDQVVHTEVLEHTHGVENIAERFMSRALENRQTKEWDQGFYAIVHEETDGPYGIFMGSKTGRKTHLRRKYIRYPDVTMLGLELGSSFECQEYENPEYDCSRGMELYNHDLGQKGRLIRLARLTTPYMINKIVKKYILGIDPGIVFSVPDWVKKFRLPEGAKFTNDYYDYTYYHNGYWEAHGGEVKEELPNMHQAWVLDASCLDEFMDVIRVLLREDDEYRRYVLGNIILEDITPVPDNGRPMFPAIPCQGECSLNVVYQITVALDDGTDKKLIGASTRFYEELSKKVQNYASVYLLKEAHVADHILMDQYGKGIAAVRDFCRRFDPDRLFSSALWERLLPDRLY